MITIKVDDAVGLLNAVKKSISTPELVNWAKTKADPYMRSQFSEQFKTEGKRYGKGWLGIKESSLEARGQKKYRKSKASASRLGGAKVSEIFGDRRVTGVNILHDTGELYNKVTQTKGEIQTTIDGVSVSWGGNLKSFKGADKYRIHQLGTEGTKRPNPARPMISGDTKDSQHLLLSLWGYMGAIIKSRRK